MKNILLLISAILFFSSCGTSKKLKTLQGQYDELKTKLERCQENADNCLEKNNAMMADHKSALNQAQSESAAKDGKIKTLEEQVDFLKKTNTNLLDRLSDLSVVSKSGAESIKRSLDAINEKDRQITQMNNSIQRKDSINLALVMNLKKSLADVNTDDVNIEVKKGVVYISLSDKMLYRSGSAIINDQAGSVLEKIARILNDQKDLDILVEGHTDNVPISTDCVADNWDLSTKRASAVVRLLQKKYGVDPSRMTAGGRSEYLPKVSNDSVDGKKTNRRTEIIILPKLDQFFKLSEPSK